MFEILPSYMGIPFGQNMLFPGARVPIAASLDEFMSWPRSAPPQLQFTPPRFRQVFLSRYGCWTKNRGCLPPKWMVKIMENPMNKWMIWGFSHIFGSTHIQGGGWKFRVFRKFVLNICLICCIAQYLLLKLCLIMFDIIFNNWDIPPWEVSHISYQPALFEDDFPFPVWWDMLVPWRVRLPFLLLSQSQHPQASSSLLDAGQWRGNPRNHMSTQDTSSTWNSKQTVFKTDVWLNNYFQCKDLVHHPIETTIKWYILFQVHLYRRTHKQFQVYASTNWDFGFEQYVRKKIRFFFFYNFEISVNQQNPCM